MDTDLTDQPYPDIVARWVNIKDESTVDTDLTDQPFWDIVAR